MKRFRIPLHILKIRNLTAIEKLIYGFIYHLPEKKATIREIMTALNLSNNNQIYPIIHKGFLKKEGLYVETIEIK